MAEPDVPVMDPIWYGFGFRKQHGVLTYLPFRSFETRNESAFKLITESLRRYPVADFGWILVYTGDIGLDVDTAFTELGDDGRVHRVGDLLGRRYPVLAFNAEPGSLVSTCPDWVYDHWRQTGLDDYEFTRLRLQSFTDRPRGDLLGWRGAATHPVRKKLVELDDKVDFDCEFIVWDRSNREKLTATNFLSLEDQVRAWRFLIDIEGVGFSARLKVLLGAPRVTFVQDRTWQEDFWVHMKPWVHYVPVRKDLADLREHVLKVKSDAALERRIIRNASLFAAEHLSRDAALARWACQIRRLADIRAGERL